MSTTPSHYRKIIIPRPGSNARFELVQAELPGLQPQQILVQTEACGVAFADVLMREGLYPNVARRCLTPGYDVVGHVVQLGSRVEHFAVGDRVACLTQTGGYADYAVADADLSVACASHLPADQVVALILNYTTAWQMLTRIARVQTGETILVHGVAGGVGSALLELGLQLGLTVYGTLSPRKWESLPAHLDQHPNFQKLDYQAAAFEQSLLERVPGSVDMVFDAIGGNHLKRSLRVVRPGGTVVSYGFSTAIQGGRRSWWSAIKGMLQSAVFPVQLIKENKILAGYGIWNYALAHPDHLREDLGHLLRWLEQGILQPMISKRYALEQTEQAQQSVASSEFPGKVILQIS